MEKFDPTDKVKYRKFEDLPVGHQDEFAPVEGGFVRKEVIEKSDIYNPDSSEKMPTKAEIEKQIDELFVKRRDIIIKQREMKEELANLLHYYNASDDNLTEFKEAKEALETRIENPTLSEKLREKFSVLFGDNKLADNEKSEFLRRNIDAQESVEYRDKGISLRSSVRYVRNAKESLRELAGEKLSFRGGRMEGEEQSPREMSIEKVTQMIRSFGDEIFAIDIELAQKRDEAFYAWKIENPTECNKLEEDIKKKEEEGKSVIEKVALFKEFLETESSAEEILDIIRHASKEANIKRDNASYQIFREYRKTFYEYILESGKTLNGVFRIILKMPSDWKSIDDDKAFLKKVLISKIIYGSQIIGRGEHGNFIDVFELQGSDDYSIGNYSFFIANLQEYFTKYKDVSEIRWIMERLLQKAQQNAENGLSGCFPVNELKEINEISNNASFSPLISNIENLTNQQLQLNDQEYEEFLKQKKLKELEQERLWKEQREQQEQQKRLEEENKRKLKERLMKRGDVSSGPDDQENDTSNAIA